MQIWISIVLMAFSTLASMLIALDAIKSHRLADKSYDPAQEIKKANQ